jgi:DNA-directed RNA polymerase subunit RPC12/RpoP
MVEKKYIYRCTSCGSSEEITEGKTAPSCCKKIMVKDPLDKCTIAEHPEMVRNNDDSEPCDDGRGKES